MNCLDKSLFSSTFVILKCRCIWVIFSFCFISLRSTASKTKCQHAVDLWLNSWRDTEELPCQSPQGLWRPSVPRQGSLGSKRALNLVILEANGRYQRLDINQGGTWRKTACWSKCQAEGNEIYHKSERVKMKGEVFWLSLVGGGRGSNLQVNKIERTLTTTTWKRKKKIMNFHTF